MYDRIVVLLDGSKLAEDVLPHVAGLIHGRSSRVFLLTVAQLKRGTAPLVGDLNPFPAGTLEQGRRIKRELTQYLQTIAQRLEPVAADVETHVRFGRPVEEILAFAAAVDADLMAMSTHGGSGISRWVFGTVADRVLRGAPCPVLLVRAGQPQPRAPYRRILVPLDGSELAEQVLPYVKAIVRPSLDSLLERRRTENSHIFLVSVLTTGLGDRTVALLTSYPPGLQLATTALHHAELQLRSYLRSVAATLREEGAAVQIHIRQGSPAEEILACAAEVEADLIGMTTHGFSGLSPWVYGNVASKVLQEARSAVLLVRPASSSSQ